MVNNSHAFFLTHGHLAGNIVLWIYQSWWYHRERIPVPVRDLLFDVDISMETGRIEYTKADGTTVGEHRCQWETCFSMLLSRWQPNDLSVLEPLIPPHESALSIERPIFILRIWRLISLVTTRTWYTKADGNTACIGKVRWDTSCYAYPRCCEYLTGNTLFLMDWSRWVPPHTCRLDFLSSSSLSLPFTRSL